MSVLRRVNERNQITLPKKVLNKIAIHPGDFLEIAIHKHTLILKPKIVADRTTIPPALITLRQIIKEYAKRKNIKEDKELKKAIAQLKNKIELP